MHNQVRQWATQGHFAALLDLLFARGFRVYITSDHGNVEAVGCGRPNEGAVADVRGERVRVYSEEGLRRRVADRFAVCVVVAGGRFASRLSAPARARPQGIRARR